MKPISRLILIAGTTVLGATSAMAGIPTMEERDAYFESCRTEYVARNMGNDDAAVAYCYPKAYGNEDWWSPPPPPGGICGPTSGYTCNAPN